MIGPKSMKFLCFQPFFEKFQEFLAMWGHIIYRYTVVVKNNVVSRFWSLSRRSVPRMLSDLKDVSSMLPLLFSIIFMEIENFLAEIDDFWYETHDFETMEFTCEISCPLGFRLDQPQFSLMCLKFCIKCSSVKCNFHENNITGIIYVLLALMTHKINKM